MKSPHWLLVSSCLCSALISHVAGLDIPYFQNPEFKVDGKLDDEVYEHLQFTPFDSELSHSGKSDIAIVEGESVKLAATRQSNRFTVFHDDNGLYLTIISPRAENSGELSATCEMPDGLFEFFRCDDMFEVYFSPVHGEHDYYWFMTNPQGNKTDLWAAGDPDRSWNGVWETASQVTEEEWIAEFFFPYATFNRTALSGPISLSLSRFHRQGMKRERWGGEFRMPQTWPEGRLEKPSACVRQDIKLVNMRIADDNTPRKGMLTAELAGVPANRELHAVWRIMRPMKARGWSPEGNGPRIELAATPAASGKNVTFSDRIDIEDDESLIAALALYLPTGELFWLSEDLALKKDHIIDGPGCEFNYYTTEEEINVHVLLNRHADHLKLKAELADESGHVHSSRILKSAPEVGFSFAAGSLPEGNYAVRLVLYEEESGKEVATREFRTAKYPPAPDIDEVKISHFTRAVQVGGEDFSSIGNSPQLQSFDLNFAKFRIQQYKGFNFNTLLVFGGYYTIDEKGIHFNQELLREFFRCAEENNFKVILGMGEWLGNAPHSPFVKYKFNDEYRFGKVRELVQLVKAEKSLLGYEAYDEPEWFLAPEYLEKVYAIIKEMDPYHLVTLNGCRGARNLLQFLRASDLVSIDYYPSGKWPVNTVVPITEEMNRFPGYKPLRWWIQAYEIFNPAPPTREEIIAMTYMVWAHGASSVLYFIGVPANELAEAQEICGRENERIADAITAPYRKELKINGNTGSPGVYASLRRKNGKTWLITVNQSSIVQNVWIEIPDDPVRVSSLFENEEVHLEAGKAEASYQPWERKVFEVFY